MYPKNKDPTLGKQNFWLSYLLIRVYPQKSGKIINPKLLTVLAGAICSPSLLTLWGHKAGQLPE